MYRVVGVTGRSGCVVVYVGTTFEDRRGRGRLYPYDLVNDRHILRLSDGLTDF